MNNLKKYCFAFLLLILTHLLCSGGTVVHTVTINPTLTDWSLTNHVPQFDRRLGALRSVQVTVDAATAPEARVVNLDVIPWLIELRTTNNIAVAVGGVVAADSKAGATQLRATAGSTLSANWSFALAGAATTNRNLGGWIGTNTVPVVTRSSARTWYSGPANYRLDWRTAASAVVAVAYTFDGKDDDKDDDKDKDKDKDDDKDKDGR
jgi:hypothetical protein